MRRTAVGRVALGFVVGCCLEGAARATPVDTSEGVAEVVARLSDPSTLLAQRDRRPPEGRPGAEEGAAERGDRGRGAPEPADRPDLRGRGAGPTPDMDRRLDMIMQRLESIERRMGQGQRPGDAGPDSVRRPMMGPPSGRQNMRRSGPNQGPNQGPHQAPHEGPQPGPQPGPRRDSRSMGPHQPPHAPAPQGPGPQGPAPHAPHGPGHMAGPGPHIPAPHAPQPGPHSPQPGPHAPQPAPHAPQPVYGQPFPPPPGAVPLAVQPVQGSAVMAVPQVFRFEARSVTAGDKDKSAPHADGAPVAHVRELKEQLERMLAERFEAHAQKAGQGIKGVAEGMERAVGQRFEEVRRVLEETHRAIGEQRERAEDTKRRLAELQERLERLEQAVRRDGAAEPPDRR